MRTFIRENSLSLAMLGCFAVFVVGLSVVGFAEENRQLVEHGQSAIGYLDYLHSASFVEAIFENWESEFLQMAAFVALTALLRQRGAPDSKPMAGRSAVDADPRRARRRDSPWPVKAGGIWLRLYEHSLTIALALLFVISFALHAIGGAGAFSEELAAHGEAPVSVFAYLGTARFWFESLQNWQSEFLSVGALIVLAIFLRQRGSTESKPVADPNSETGSQ
ncbi:MAG: hypothetical protein M3R49_07810 [Chloroflexota bacterium]|nr:hypothetical protein [Chloroflexota bacterium]